MQNLAPMEVLIRLLNGSEYNSLVNCHNCEEWINIVQESEGTFASFNYIIFFPHTFIHTSSGLAISIATRKHPLN